MGELTASSICESFATMPGLFSAELLANDPPDNEQRFHQHGQIGEVLDRLPDTRLELNRPDHADLETEVAQGGT
jgi:hypothetical protein